MTRIAPETIAALLEDVRTKRPLVHHMTNTVTINDCANVTLAIGAAPVMAEAIEEVGEMAGHANALVLNIGTLSRSQVLSMLEAGKAANSKKIPIVFDPVGAGATSMRTSSAQMILEDMKVTILKGNAGEIGVLAGADAKVRGVDSAGITGDIARIAKDYAKASGLIVAVSGATDIITDGKQTVFVENGHPMMGRLSGTGCMAASLTGAFAGVTDNRVAATAAAFAAFGIAGELAAAAAKGPYSFRLALVDAIATLTPADLAARARIRQSL